MIKKNIKKIIKKILGEKICIKLYSKVYYRICHFKYYHTNRRKMLENKYKMNIGKKLDLDNPTTFNDKLNWLKLNWYDEIATLCVDKYRVREVVQDRGCADTLNELIAVYDNAKEIDWDKLPSEFILKVNNGCGNHVICTDKSLLDKRKAIKTLNQNLKKTYAVFSGEWPYEKVQPKIICEKLLDEHGHTPTDYKIFCCNGEPKYLFLATDRDTKTKFDFYDLNFKKIPVKQYYENSDKCAQKPKNFEKMLEIAKKLSKGFPFVRVDLYNIDGKIIFGEYTFFHFGGGKEYEPDEYNRIFGDMIKLPPIVKTEANKGKNLG